jgi:hypothetical protein
MLSLQSSCIAIERSDGEVPGGAGAAAKWTSGDLFAVCLIDFSQALRLPYEGPN